MLEAFAVRCLGSTPDGVIGLRSWTYVRVWLKSTFLESAGMWLSGTTYRKIPHAMLSALAMVPNIRLRGSGLDKRALEVIDYFKIPVENVQERQLPHAILQQEMRRTHLTMYVTFIECCWLPEIRKLS